MGQRLMFLKSFLKQPRVVGAVLPSSFLLAEEMLDQIDWGSSAALAEIGPGTGVFTEKILERISDTTRFFAVEIQQSLVDDLRMRFPGIDIQRADACELRELCDLRGIASLDAVISGLPWALFEDRLQRELLSAILKSLSPEGKFSTFAYLQGLKMPAGRRFRGLLEEHFRTVRASSIVWRNFPPAIVYHCQR